MVALNFQARFVADIVSGKKRQTIRKRRRDGRDPKPGGRLQIYTAMRTKACRKLISPDPVCAATAAVSIRYAAPGVAIVAVDSIVLGVGDLRYIAHKDGFKSGQDMIDWFDKTHGLPFDGLLIWWDVAPCA